MHRQPQTSKGSSASIVCACVCVYVWGQAREMTLRVFPPRAPFILLWVYTHTWKNFLPFKRQPLLCGCVRCTYAHVGARGQLWGVSSFSLIQPEHLSMYATHSSPVGQDFGVILLSDALIARELSYRCSCCTHFFIQILLPDEPPHQPPALTCFKDRVSQ